ncbi:MAG: hypothetical protein II737_08120 [Mailhella sp.]|nr:hypothetical protein [Mailhella sp.]
MNATMIFSCAWLLALAAVLFLYVKTGSNTKWNNCAAILAPLLPAVVFMPFAAAVHVQGKEPSAAFCALSLCTALFPFLLFFLVNRHIERKGEGRLSPLCLPVIALLVPLCMGMAYVIALQIFPGK